jgi:membrane associated rhomboid family serine protease
LSILFRLRPVPWVTVLIVGVTAVIASLGLVDPAVLSALRRDPGALAAGQWWRLLTPLLVRADSWPVLALILAFTAAAGALVEQLLGIPELLLLYLAAGVTGQAFGYAWDPHGAGSSVAMLGLVSGLWVMTLRTDRRAPLGVRMVAAAGLCLVAALLAGRLLRNSLIASALAAAGTAVVTFNLVPRLRNSLAEAGLAVTGLAAGVILTALQDNHGPAILAGACVAGLLLLRPRVAEGIGQQSRSQR